MHAHQAPHSLSRRTALRLAAALAATPWLRPSGAQDKAPHWRRAAPASLARQELYPEVLGGRIYVAGGLLSPNTGYSAHLEAYDPATDRWMRLATLPEARHHIALAAVGDELHAVGGFSGGFPNWQAQASCYVYTPADNRWRPGVDLPAPNAEGVVAALGGKVYVVGGRVLASADARHFNAHVDTARGLVFDPASARWSAIAEAPTARNSAASAVIDGLLYVLGGRQALPQPDGTLRQVNVAQLEVYDPVNDRWSTRAPMPQAQGGLAAAAQVAGSTCLAASSGCPSRRCSPTAGCTNRAPTDGPPCRPCPRPAMAWAQRRWETAFTCSEAARAWAAMPPRTCTKSWCWLSARPMLDRQRNGARPPPGRFAGSRFRSTLRACAPAPAPGRHASR